MIGRFILHPAANTSRLFSLSCSCSRHSSAVVRQPGGNACGTDAGVIPDPRPAVLSGREGAGEAVGVCGVHLLQGTAPRCCRAVFALDSQVPCPPAACRAVGGPPDPVFEAALTALDLDQGRRTWYHFHFGHTAKLITIEVSLRTCA